MKKSILTLLVFVPFLTFSQDLLTYKGHGRIENINNEKLKSPDVRTLMATNKEALHLYNSGKTKQTLGNVFLYTGISTVVIKHFSALKKNNINSDGSINYSKDNTLYYVGGGMILAALPIKIGFSKKIKKAVALLNDDLKNPPAGFTIDSTSFIANSNGIGFAVTF